MSWLFQPIPAAGQQQAAGAAAQPNGWHRPFETAPLRVIIPVALVASGLVWCPQPIAASPSNSVTIDKWQQPLSVAPRVAQAQQGSTLVPFDTRQFVPPVTIDKWQQPLSQAVPAAIALQGVSFAPFNTAQTNTSTIDKWLQPLSIAVPVTKAQQGDGSVPLNTAQINTTTIDKWQQPLVAAIKLTGPVHTQPSFIVPPFEVPRGWYQQLSTAVPVGKARFADQQFPFYPATVDNNVTLDKWQQPLSAAVSVAKAWQGDTFVPFNTVQPVAGFVSYASYQQPLSVVPATFKAQPGYSDVPFNTAQINTVTVDRWLQPLSVAAPVAKAVHSQASFVALPFPQYLIAWQQPLSQAVKSNQAVPTQPIFVTVSVDVPRGWYQALSQAPLVAKAQFADQPLQFAPSVAADNNVTLDKWQQPLSVPVPVAKAQPGSSFVPFDTAQTQPAGIAGMAWFAPLGTVPYSAVYAPQQFITAPIQFGEIAPSPVDTTVGGTRHRRPGGQGISRKKWKELQEEIAAERRAILAEEKRLRDEAAKVKRDAEVARKVKIAAKAQELADKQRLQTLVVESDNLTAAQEAAKAEQEFLAAMLAEIANQEDEDEVIMLLLGL